MKMLRLRNLGTLALITALVLLLCSCGQNKNKQTPQQQSETGDQQSEKIPDQLKKIDQSIEQIFKELKGPTLAKEETTKDGQKGKSEQEQTGQKQSTNKKEENNDKGSSNKEESTKEQGEQEKQPTQQPEQPDPWQKINTIVNELHYQWNSYSPMALKVGVNSTSMDNFSKSLNTLTNTLNSKNSMNTMMAASTLYGYVPDFYYLYKTKSSPEIKKVTHYTRSSMLFGMSGNWAQADADVINLKSSWNMYKNTVPKEQKEMVSKLEYAIYEYEKVEKEKNQQLVDIKGRVTLSNIEALEKAMEEAEKK